MVLGRVFTSLWLIYFFEIKKSYFYKSFLSMTILVCSFFSYEFFANDPDILDGWTKTQEKRVLLLDYSCADYLEKNYNLWN